MEKYGFVYIWRDRKHKRFYIGAHWGTEDDGYVCSSKWMKQAYKIRPQDFKRRILERVYTSKKDTFIVEEKWLQLIKPEELRKRYYNFFRFVNAYWCNKEKHLIAMEKISQANTGRRWNHTEEAKKKISKGRTGIIFSEEHKDNLRKAKAGNTNASGKRSEEFRLRMREASKGNSNAAKKA